MARPARFQGATTQIALRLPDEWLTRADVLAHRLSRPGIPTSRTEALRAAVLAGLDALEK